MKKKFCVVNSKRGSSITDTNRAVNICNTVKQNLGINYDGVTGQLDLLEHSEQCIEALLPIPFNFDNRISNYIYNLPSRCEEEDCGEENKQACGGVIGYRPMRKIKHIAPEIYYFGGNDE